MLAYQLLVNKNEVFVLLNSSTPNQYATIEYKGNDKGSISRVREWLEWEHGAFGHILGRKTTPIDLSAAMNSDRAKAFSPKRISGGEIIQEYNSGTPEGAKT